MRRITSPAVANVRHSPAPDGPRQHRSKLSTDTGFTTVVVSCVAASGGVLAFAAPTVIGLPNSMGAFGLLVVVFGLWVFVDHGGHRVTAVGVYCLTAGLSIGTSCLYYRTSNPGLVTRNDIYEAAIWAYLATVAMYAGWWQWSSRESGSNPPRQRSHITGYARTTGFVLLVVGLVLHFVHATDLTIGSAATFDGSVLLGSSFLFGDSDRRRPALWQIVACCAALGVYVASQFSGGGRLVLVSLGFAMAFLVQDRIHFRHFKWVIIVAAVPTLVVFAYVGQTRSPGDTTEQQASGLSSVVTPLNNFALEIQDGLSHRGPGPLVGDIIFPIPRAIWHSKPLAFGQSLAANLSPAVFASNQSNSVAALNLGEWYYIAGWDGFVFMCIFTGFVVAWLDRRLRRSHSRRLSERKAFLGFVALSIVAAGLPDLAWAGTSTWSAAGNSPSHCVGAIVVVGDRRRKEEERQTIGNRWSYECAQSRGGLGPKVSHKSRSDNGIRMHIAHARRNGNSTLRRESNHTNSKYVCSRLNPPRAGHPDRSVVL